MVIVSAKEIHFDSELRLRQDYGDVKRMVVSFHKYGQLQDCLVREPNGNEPLPDGKNWVLVDGGRRLLAVELAARSDIEIKDLEPGQIGIKVRGQEDKLYALELEFFANEDRKNFDWREKAEFVKRIHEGHMAGGEEWSVLYTAALLEMGDKTVYKYLDFFDHPDAFKTEEVQQAETFNTAYKQFQIKKDFEKRKRLVKHRDETIEKRTQEVAISSGGEVVQVEVSDRVAYVPPSEFAQLICQLGDCREYISQVPTDTFDWIHWDPPYGGEQAGGAFGTFERIDDSWVYAKMLLTDMFPDVWRTLRGGHWFVLWYHPQYYNDIVTMLRGHERDWETHRCIHCDREWETENLLVTCRNEKWRFWVNPYPNTWYKVDRLSAGQEIRRFLINAQEHFLFAAAVKEKEKPILPSTNRQNVFVNNMPTSEERRHSMHKPAKLLGKILEVISIPGELGYDPSYGSGSIFEAALRLHRKIVGTELDKQIRSRAIEAVEEAIKEHGVEPYTVDFSQ